MLIKSSSLIYVWEKLRSPFKTCIETIIGGMSLIHYQSRLLIGSLQTDIRLGFSL